MKLLIASAMLSIGFSAVQLVRFDVDKGSLERGEKERAYVETFVRRCRFMRRLTFQ